MAGEPEGLAVLARRQTAGRGSRGRDWSSPAGNLSLSVLLRPTEALRNAGQWSLLAAVALADALAPLLPPSVALTLKWPNDVLLDDRKLAGILIDTSGAGNEVAWLSIGVGVNLAVAPDLADRACVCLAEMIDAPTADAVAAAFMDSLDRWRATRLLDGFAAIRAAWLARAHAIGCEITLKVGVQRLGGTFAGLADDGSLLLQSGGRVRAFSTGEVLRGEVLRGEQS